VWRIEMLASLPLGDLTAHLADVVSGEDFETFLHGRLL
jgi:hypothetical protein